MEECILMPSSLIKTILADKDFAARDSFPRISILTHQHRNQDWPSSTFRHKKVNEKKKWKANHYTACASEPLRHVGSLYWFIFLFFSIYLFDFVIQRTPIQNLLKVRRPCLISPTKTTVSCWHSWPIQWLDTWTKLGVKHTQHVTSNLLLWAFSIYKDVVHHSQTWF